MTQIIDFQMWPVNKEGVPIVNTVTYPERSIKVVDNIYTIPIQKPGTGQVIQVKMKTAVPANQFQIKLTRDDGTIIGWPVDTYNGDSITINFISTISGSKYPTVYASANGDNEYWTLNSETGIWSYSPFDEGDEYYGTVLITFNPETNYWTCDKWPWAEIAVDEKFWINARCIWGVSVQYPYRYKPADKLNPNDAVRPGKYDVQIPYFKTVYSFTPNNLSLQSVQFWSTETYNLIGHSITCSDKTLLSEAESVRSIVTEEKLYSDKYAPSVYWWPISLDATEKQLIVYSSVPWILSEEINNNQIYAYVYENNSSCLSNESGWCVEYIRDVAYTSLPTNITVIGSNISYSGDSLFLDEIKVATEYSASIGGSSHKITLNISVNEDILPMELLCQDRMPPQTWHSYIVGENFIPFAFTADGVTLISKTFFSASPKLT